MKNLDEIIDANRHSGKPTTLDEAVSLVMSTLGQEDLELLRDNDDAIVVAHHNFGRYLRNRLRLWEDSPMREWFKINMQIGHADDISTIILEATQQKLRGRLYCPQATIKRCHEHWQKYGCNSFGEPLDETI